MKVTGFRCDVDNEFGEEGEDGGPPPHWFIIKRAANSDDGEPTMVCSSRCLAKLGREIQAREQVETEKKVSRTSSPNKMPCPECGRKDFGSVLALSIHRSKAHGVKGSQIQEEREQAKER